MFKAINTNFAQTTLAIAATVVVGIAITSAPAAAKGSRQLQTHDYHFNQAMHGYEGHANGVTSVRMFAFQSAFVSGVAGVRSAKFAAGRCVRSAAKTIK